MLVFSKNKYISACIKEDGQVYMSSWVDEFEGKPVEKSGDDYQEIGGNYYMASPQWVAEVDDKYLK